jgi:hypothetical protein
MTSSRRWPPRRAPSGCLLCQWDQASPSAHSPPVTGAAPFVPLHEMERIKDPPAARCFTSPHYLPSLLRPIKAAEGLTILHRTIFWPQPLHPACLTSLPLSSMLPPPSPPLRRHLAASPSLMRAPLAPPLLPLSPPTLVAPAGEL